jgi:hypothetical protein
VARSLRARAAARRCGVPGLLADVAADAVMAAQKTKHGSERATKERMMQIDLY